MSAARLQYGEVSRASALYRDVSYVPFSHATLKSGSYNSVQIGKNHILDINFMYLAKIKNTQQREDI